MDHSHTHVVNPRTPAKQRRETAARQPRNSRNTPCDTRKTGAKHRETAERHPRNIRESVQGTHRG
eukprot:244709-Prymnesium_polylepis.1